MENLTPAEIAALEIGVRTYKAQLIQAVSKSGDYKIHPSDEKGNRQHFIDACESVQAKLNLQR